MKADLPTAFTAAPTIVERAVSSPDAGGRRRRAGIAVAMVAAMLAVVFWLVSGGRVPTTRLTVDRRPVWVAGHQPTVASALAAARVRPHDGALYSVVTRRLLNAHATPAEVLVDGVKAQPSQRVEAGDRILVRDGADSTEGISHRRVRSSGTGFPPVEDRIWLSDRQGLDEVDVGDHSGEIVSRANVAPGGTVHPEMGMVVALTFDDGPDPRWTPAILQILKDENVKATFCTIGYLAQRHPDLVRAEHDAGHSSCDHSMHHILNLPSRPHPQIVDEVLQGADVIRNVLGENPIFYRPPGGSLNQDIIDTAHSHGLRVLKWSVDPHDYAKPPAPVILARVTAKIGPGAVVLLHDGGGDRSQTVAMLKQLIDELRARGFSFYAWQ